MTEDPRPPRLTVATPEGPPPVGGGEAERDIHGVVQREWLSQRNGWRMTLAALAVPSVLVLGSFAAMLWFWLWG
ncbi:hypothetical protein [Paracoccus tibetensis]|uniref:Uncharacterized protein n=1 Tax=Paracoccus tibetensis TaxID=336292 RepID=A0A1G5HYC9_9RHOB|nr:hypothetical protein [Paracoccus tibetensis]SCY68865.1 hypothetical protein SAMN05660710_02390 [Paracoccus tibetensis]